MAGVRGAVRRLAPVLVTCVLATSACTADAPPSQSASASVTAEQILVDDAALLQVSPVDYEGAGLLVATFSDAAKGRTVELQRRTAEGWEKVESGKQDANGTVEFRKTVPGADTFRAVAQAADGEPATATAEASAAQQWTEAFTSEFEDDALKPGAWGHRSLDIFDAFGRHCAAPHAESVGFADGAVQLAVTEEKESAQVAKAKAAGCKERRVFKNAMISTEGLFKVKAGTLAARIKFAEGQGMHGAVWLQSYDKSEIDMIESYGYGVGLTSVIHVDGQRYPTDGGDTYVIADTVTDRDWWSKYHTYSVEWDNESVVFRVDGKVSKRIAHATPDTEYFIVASMLSSDWEQKRFKNPVDNAEGVTPTTLPQTMSVDWIKVWTPA